MVSLWVGIRVPMRQQPSLPISSITGIPGLSQFSSCLYNTCPEDHLTHIPQEDRSKCHHFSCHRFEILKSNVLIISEIFIKDILHFHDLAGYMLAHCTWHEHE
jgi:hypothetical protein